jgi:hypothetical protein
MDGEKQGVPCLIHQWLELHGHLRSIFEAPNLKSARSLLHTTIDSFAAQAPKAVDILEQGFDDATAVLILPERYRKRLRTTNSIERLNEEIRRRERVIRILSTFLTDQCPFGTDWCLFNPSFFIFLYRVFFCAS